MNRRGNYYDDYQKELIEQQNKDKMNRKLLFYRKGTKFMFQSKV